MAGDLLPYFKFYPAETIADERFSGWTLLERGAWLTLLLHAWVNGSIPSDQDALARILHIDAVALRSLWVAIGDRFTAMDHLPEGRLSSPRLEQEREEALARMEAGKKGANSRWKKKNPKPAPAIRPHSDRNAEPMPTEQLRSAQSRSDLPPTPLGRNGTPEQQDRAVAAWAVLVPVLRPRVKAEWLEQLMPEFRGCDLVLLSPSREIANHLQRNHAEYALEHAPEALHLTGTVRFEMAPNSGGL